MYDEPEPNDPARTESQALDDRVDDGENYFEAAAWNEDTDPVAHL